MKNIVTKAINMSDIMVYLAMFSTIIDKGWFQTKNKKMVGFIQRSSDPSQPGRALDKKNQKLHNFFYVCIIFILAKFGENFEEEKRYLLLLKCFWGKIGSQKV